MKKKQTVREELEEYLGTKISDEQYQKCILAFRSSHQGPAALGGYAVMGYYAPFQSISKELGKSIACFFNGVGVSNFMSDGQKRSDRRQELIERLKEARVQTGNAIGKKKLSRAASRLLWRDTKILLFPSKFIRTKRHYSEKDCGRKDMGFEAVEQHSSPPATQNKSAHA